MELGLMGTGMPFWKQTLSGPLEYLLITRNVDPGGSFWFRRPSPFAFAFAFLLGRVEKEKSELCTFFFSFCGQFDRPLNHLDSFQAIGGVYIYSRLGPQVQSLLLEICHKMWWWGGRRETLMGHDQNIIIKQRMKCLSQDGPIYLFIYFYKMKVE